MLGKIKVSRLIGIIPIKSKLFWKEAPTIPVTPFNWAVPPILYLLVLIQLTIIYK